MQEQAYNASTQRRISDRTTETHQVHIHVQSIVSYTVDFDVISSP